MTTDYKSQSLLCQIANFFYFLKPFKWCNFCMQIKSKILWSSHSARWPHKMICTGRIETAKMAAYFFKRKKKYVEHNVGEALAHIFYANILIQCSCAVICIKSQSCCIRRKKLQKICARRKKVQVIYSLGFCIIITFLLASQRKTDCTFFFCFCSFIWRRFKKIFLERYNFFLLSFLNSALLIHNLFFLLHLRSFTSGFCKVIIVISKQRNTFW